MPRSKLTQVERDMEELGFPSRATQLRRFLDREIFLPIAAKHGMEITSAFMGPQDTDPDSLSDLLESGLGQFSDFEREDEP